MLAWLPCCCRYGARAGVDGGGAGIGRAVSDGDNPSTGINQRITRHRRRTSRGRSHGSASGHGTRHEHDVSKACLGITFETLFGLTGTSRATRAGAACTVDDGRASVKSCTVSPAGAGGAVMTVEGRPRVRASLTGGFWQGTDFSGLLHAGMMMAGYTSPEQSRPSEDEIGTGSRATVPCPVSQPREGGATRGPACRRLQGQLPAEQPRERDPAALAEERPWPPRSHRRAALRPAASSAGRTHVSSRKGSSRMTKFRMTYAQFVRFLRARADRLIDTSRRPRAPGSCRAHRRHLKAAA